MNLIITCPRHLEPETEAELKNILEELGDSEVEVTITSMSGILTASTKLDEIKVVREIKEILLDEPWRIRYCKRIIPIQQVIKSHIQEMQKSVAKLACQISDGETYRVLIEKRNSDLSSKEIITQIAEQIKNTVSLEFPDKVILVEILGNKTGISILKKTDILSTEKTKRSISE